MFLFLLFVQTALADDCKQYADADEIKIVRNSGAFDKNLMTSGPVCKAKKCECVDNKDVRDFDIVGGEPVYNDQKGSARKAASEAEALAEKQEIRDKADAFDSAKSKIADESGKLGDVIKYLKLRDYL